MFVSSPERLYGDHGGACRTKFVLLVLIAASSEVVVFAGSASSRKKVIWSMRRTSKHHRSQLADALGARRTAPSSRKELSCSRRRTSADALCAVVGVFVLREKGYDVVLMSKK